jgi:hypothetical protein
MRQETLGPYRGLYYGLTISALFWLVGLNLGLAM